MSADMAELPHDEPAADEPTPRKELSAVPIPTSVAELDLLYRLARRPTLNDIVQRVVKSLIADPKFQKLIRAGHDSQAVEGSMAADNFMAAMMVREKATEDKVEDVIEENLSTINRALQVVLRRYGLGRKQRRYTIDGEFIPPPKNGDDE